MLLSSILSLLSSLDLNIFFISAVNFLLTVSRATVSLKLLVIYFDISTIGFFTSSLISITCITYGSNAILIFSIFFILYKLLSILYNKFLRLEICEIHSTDGASWTQKYNFRLGKDACHVSCATISCKFFSCMHFRASLYYHDSTNSHSAWRGYLQRFCHCHHVQSHEPRHSHNGIKLFFCKLLLHKESKIKIWFFHVINWCLRRFCLI